MTEERNETWERVKALDLSKLTPEDMADTSIEDARMAENAKEAERLHQAEENDGR